MGSNPDLNQISSKEERFLKELTRLLEESISTGEIAITEISREMGMSRSTFYRRMKESTGYSPVEYIRIFQLKKAATLLDTGFGNVSEIAYEVGFNNLSYFAKCFKEEFGITPGKYVTFKRSKDNLPVQITSFVGREQELTDLKDLISRYRLINLTGPAGTGKTRLALELIQQMKSKNAFETFVVYLAPLSDPGLVPSAILQELRVIKNSTQSSMESLMDYLQDRKVLLVLDNFEHLTEAASELDTLLRHCSELKILTTSREVLHLSGEYQYPVSPLSIPGPVDNITESTLETLKSYPSVRLFLERAQTVTGNFQLNSDNAADVVRICHYTDGLPLALELAASQIKLFSPYSLAERLSESLSVLKSGDRDRPERHHTLLSAISWSYNLLTENEKTLFQRLSLFAGSFNLKAAESVWANDALDFDILDGLRSLLDKNLLQTAETDGKIRFKLLETLKTYGQKKLYESRKEKEVVKKMAIHFLEMARNAESQLKGPEQKYWANRLGRELDNFRGILSDLHQHREVELGLQLSTALCRYWNMQNLMREGKEWLRKIIDLADTLKYHEKSRKTFILKGKALSALGVLVGQLSEDFQKAAGIFRQCITVFRRIDDRSGLAENLNHYGWIKAHMGDYAEAVRISGEAKKLNSEFKNDRGVSVALNNLGWIANARGNLEHAEQLFSESISLRDKIGDRRGSAYVSANLAWVGKSLGKYERALSRLEESYAILSELNDRQLISWVHTIKGYIFYDRAQYEKGRETLEMAAEGWSLVGNRYGLSLSYGLLGLSLLSTKKTEEAYSRFEQAHTYWSVMNSKWGFSFSEYCLAQYKVCTGQAEQAMSLHKKALSLRIKQDEKLSTCESLEACAKMTADKNDYETAAALLSTADSLRISIKAPRPPRCVKGFEDLTIRARKQLGNNSFNQVWEKGRKYSFEQLLSTL